jgi:hypothetical protein
VIGAAIRVARIATGEEDDDAEANEGAAVTGSKGGRKRAANLSAERRSEIAKKAAEKRWGAKGASWPCSFFSTQVRQKK